MSMPEKCIRKLHDLKVILAKNATVGTQVVRWCQGCGAIVVDIDLDNRTSPGAVMKMRLPKIATK